MYFLIYSEIGWQLFIIWFCLFHFQNTRRSFLILLDRAKKKGEVAKKMWKRIINTPGTQYSVFPTTYNYVWSLPVLGGRGGGGGGKNHWNIERWIKTPTHIDPFFAPHIGLVAFSLHGAPLYFLIYRRKKGGGGQKKYWEKDS